MRFRWLFVGLLFAVLISTGVILAAAQPVACPGAPLPRLTVGATARPAQVFSSLRADVGSDVILRVLYKSTGDQFQVLEGPLCSFGPHNWYKVDYKGTVGYVTEGQGSTYWVEPVTTTPATAVPTVPPVATATPSSPVACPGAPAPRLTVGTIARPAQVYSSLRAALDSNDILRVLFKANRDTVTVLEGPACASGPYNWYRVRHTASDTVGWVTEGTGSTYWVEPMP